MNHWLGLILAQAISGAAPPLDDRAVRLEVTEDKGQVVVQVQSNSPRAQTISFTIEVSGSSHGKHSGSLAIAANDPRTLSTLKVGTTGDWCATLRVEEEGRAPYELREGACEDQGHA